MVQEQKPFTLITTHTFSTEYTYNFQLYLAFSAKHIYKMHILVTSMGLEPEAARKTKEMVFIYS